MAAENLVLESFLERYAVFGPHENIDFPEVRAGTENFFKDNLSEVACAPRH